MIKVFSNLSSVKISSWVDRKYNSMQKNLQAKEKKQLHVNKLLFKRIKFCKYLKNCLI